MQPARIDRILAWKNILIRITTIFKEKYLHGKEKEIELQNKLWVYQHSLRNVKLKQ